jgi:hypothetical protein
MLGFLFGGAMSLESIIEARIRKEAEKLNIRYHGYHNSLEIDYQRNKKRIVDVPRKEVRTPDYWAEDKKFNPFYVNKHAKSIAHSITSKIRKETYKPNPPHIMQVEKPSGGHRNVTIYQIPDAAISSLYYDQLLAKNKHRFSSFSYAYRNDRNVHFAIQDIAVDLKQHARTFVAEFDFSDFFGSISHDFLYAQLNKNGFFVSHEEREIIKSFLEIDYKGIPQGTSISLFLANLVCWEMDKQLEKNGLQFARYADDTVVWCQDYGRICTAFEVIHDFSVKAGVAINTKKSDGISLLTTKGIPPELSNAKYNINFLGYSISADKISIKEQSVKKIKKQISYLLYRNLIQPLKGPKLKSITIPSAGKDKGFLVAMMQVRRYLYGNLSETQIRNFLLGRRKMLKFKGVMSYYPLLDDEKQLRSLDGWLLTVIFKCLQLRAKLLLKWHFNVYSQFPFNVPKEMLVHECKKVLIAKKRLLQIPSFFRIYLAIQKGITNQGIEKTMNPDSGYHYSF